MIERSRLDPVECLYTASQQIAAAPHLDGMLQAFINAFSGEHDPAARIASAPVDSIMIAWTRDNKRLGLIAHWDKHLIAPPRDRSFDLLSCAELNRITQPIVANSIAAFDEPIVINVQLLQEMALRSCVLLPLSIRGETQGVVLLGSRQSDVFSEKEVRLYQVLASQVTPSLIHYIVEQMKDNAQSDMQKERDLYESILETANDAILMVDTSRKIVAANLHFERFFQVSRYTILNQHIDKLVEYLREQGMPSDLSKILLTYGSDVQQTVGGSLEITLPAIGQIVLVWYSAPVPVGDAAYLGRLFVFRDATQQREIDEMKTQFVSLVSHELRTPLTSIKGFTDFILDGDAGEISDGVRQYLTIVQANASRLVSLVNDILDITRVETGKLDLRRDWHSVESLIGASVMTMKPMIDERKQTLKVNIEPDLPRVWVDRERITQVITNLLNNASKYTDTGKPLRIEASLSWENTSTLIGVHDSGIGIPEADQARVFDRFYRTNQATQNQIMGSGLGLAIVKSLVELHGGSVWLHSEPGKGSSFYFTIPNVTPS